MTGKLGENPFAALPTALYGAVLLMCGARYWMLQRRIMAVHGHDSVLARAVGQEVKRKASLVNYATAVPLALWGQTMLAGLLYVLVAVMWLVPDRRIERALSHTTAH